MNGILVIAGFISMFITGYFVGGLESDIRHDRFLDDLNHIMQTSDMKIYDKVIKDNIKEG